MEFKLNAAMFTREQRFEPFVADRVYDVIIIGGGPAGLTAAVYCMRKGLSAGIIVKEMGGQVAETSGIENYMGYRYINGAELVEKFREQVLQFGIAFEEGSSVTGITDGDVKSVIFQDGRTFSAKALIITSGKSWRKLGVPGEKELTGKGVAYCTTCDAPFFAGKKVMVVGGGNSGIEAAIDLARVAVDVTVIQNLDELTGDKVLVERLKEHGNVKVLYGQEIAGIKGEEKVTAVRVRDRKTKIERDMAADGIFVEIGLVPNTGFVQGFLELNEFGEIKVDSACNTSRPGIFAAGDVTSVPYKQIIIAGGEGAKAALSACDYVMKTQ